ncbi:hypothetical protein SCORR_v1c03750 [Spiroplasma corruscae]|uniref:Uncharacterized protein n=1 Tax=Spiroplasma corruscae TaxID=216934 RepID=A0A222ENS7_9MOLU|nr:hypothetical protein [Spiroplasma corruscae]ASP28149.1 hypothetical protein SCORR_v1c03750 [Spiroplasma corruscae]
MHVKKLIVKNFVTPGVQSFEFNEDGELINGNFLNPYILRNINDLINGLWIENTISFEKYYPKFAKKINERDMDLQIDALFELSKDELVSMNRILKDLGNRTPYLSRVYYYSIKCVYPYIFPIITIVPADDHHAEDVPFGLGLHYDKFFRPNISKKEIITNTGIKAVGLIRDKYFQYLSKKVDDDYLLIHREYLDLIKSLFRFDNDFIKKLGKIIYEINDGDIINFGDQEGFFLTVPEFNNYLDSFHVLRENSELKEDFLTLLFDTYLVDLQWIYSVKSANDIYEMKTNLLNNHCDKSFYSKELLDFFNFEFDMISDSFDFTNIVELNEHKLDKSLIADEIVKDRKIITIYKDETNETLPEKPTDTKSLKTYKIQRAQSIRRLRDQVRLSKKEKVQKQKRIKELMSRIKKQQQAKK